MNIDIVQGIYSEAIEYCKSDEIENIPFELAYIDTDDKAFGEFNRFIEDTMSNDVVGQSEKKRVILNLAAWNEKYCYNHYLESFLYMMFDMATELEYKIILEKEINKDLYDKLASFKLFAFSRIPLLTMVKKEEQTKIGFCFKDK